MGRIVEPTGHSLDLLDLVVVRLARSVGDAMTRAGHNVVYV
ncbi:MAG TPA: hypothetical protein VLH56_06060 [Dissulfurispiraceae bacterium]|nr:hypothetical protein [Dissulfurispiraceae bacterium]